MRLGLIGYGALGQQLEQLEREGFSRFQDIIYFDDIAHKNNIKNSYTFSSFFDNRFADCVFLVTLGYKHLREKEKILSWLCEANRKIHTFIHPSVMISKNALIGKGSIIFPCVNLCLNVKIGHGCLLYNHVTVSHDSSLGNSVVLAPGVTIAGNSTIGTRTFIGTQTAVTDHINIGNDCIIGIGSVVTQNLSNNTSAIGNPLRILTSPLKL